MTEPAFDNSKCGFEFVEAIENFEFISDCEIIDAPDAVSECVPGIVLPEPRLEQFGGAGPIGPIGPIGPTGPSGPAGKAPIVTADGTINLTADNVKASLDVDTVFDEETLIYTFTYNFTFEYDMDPPGGGCCVWWSNGVGGWSLIEGNEDCLCGGDNGVTFTDGDPATDCSPCGTGNGNISIVCLDDPP